jgi:hypothetical protein
MSTAPVMCGLEAVLVVMGGKWKPLILFHLGPSKRPPAAVDSRSERPERLSAIYC